MSAAAAAAAAVRIRELPRGGEAAWDAFLAARPEATFFHLAGWRGVIEAAFGHATCYLQAERGGAITGVLPLTHVRSRLFGDALVSNAFCVYGGPVAADETSRRALEEEAVRRMEALGAPHLEFRLQQRARPDWHARDDLYVTFRRPIAADHEANMKAIPRKQRAMVRKGMANGLAGEVDEDVDRLHRVYAESVRNLGTPVFAKSYFRILKETFGAACEILTIVKGGEPLAAVMSFHFRDEVLPYYGGGREAARPAAANDFMYWEVMRRAADRGARLFDFGRSKVGTGSYDFKHHWGFPAQPLAHEYRLAPGRTVPDVNPLNPKYRLFIAAWRRLPLPVARAIGPLIVRGLG